MSIVDYNVNINLKFLPDLITESRVTFPNWMQSKKSQYTLRGTGFV